MKQVFIGSEIPHTAHRRTSSFNDRDVKDLQNENELLGSLINEANIMAEGEEKDEMIEEKRKGNHVRFSDMEVRMYRLVPGDHPDVSAGVPTSLAWSFKNCDKVDIDSYEHERGSKRRSIKSLRMSIIDREERLRQRGYSTAELQKSIIAARKIKRDRRITQEFSKYYDMIDKSSTAINSAMHNMKNAFTCLILTRARINLVILSNKSDILVQG